MLNGIITGVHNERRFFRIYGKNGADVAALASPLGEDHKQLVVSNQNLSQENFRYALESLMAEFSENSTLFCEGRKSQLASPCPAH